MIKGIVNKIPLRNYHGNRHQTRKPCPVPGAAHLPRDGSYKIYKYLALLLGLPSIAAVAVTTFAGKSHDECDRPPFVKYETMRRRTKRFPWGEGNKSLFHNPHVNPLPDGYEELEEE